MIHRLRAVPLLLCLSLVSPSLAAVPDVFVEPLALYNTPDLDSLAQGLRAMLASRIEGEGYTVRTQGDPPTALGDWVVRTTITRLGKIYSLDTALEPAAGTVEGSRSYQTAEAVDQLVPALEKVADHIRSNLMARIRVQPAPPASPSPAPVATPSSGPTPMAAPAPQALTPSGQAPDWSALFRNPRSGPEVDGQALGLVVADTDADGNQEIVVLFKETIVAFRYLGGNIQQVWDSPAPQEFTPAAISAGDFDGNGIPELLIAGTRFRSPTTQALEWFGSALAPKGARVHGFLRAVQHPEHGALLLGMAPGSAKSLFDFGIRQYRWTGTGYAQQGPYPLTERAIGVNVDFLQFDSKAEPITVITTQGDQVLGLDGDGHTLFETDQDVKGSKIKLFGEEKTAGMQDEDIVQISGRTVGYRSPGGENLLLLYKNSGGIGRLFERIAGFSSGRMLAYRWDGLGLDLVAEGAKFSGYIADIGVSSGNGSRPVLVAALVREDNGLLKDATTRLMAYDLP